MSGLPDRETLRRWFRQNPEKYIAEVRAVHSFSTRLEPHTYNLAADRYEGTGLAASSVRKEEGPRDGD